ncbi:glutathione S-transferase family protein [Roseococcus microcysteis]|uniref:glutathione S-transferase family protein n=1 Tax=Roseococcus microcysteis TaxID=2771361 RepID=UPI00168B6A1B|nr:glutathione S-transferase family protein [Roseococcus microcysteis]
MGLLINGAWHAETPLVATKDGAFVRNESPFRNWVTADGAPGPTGEGGFKAEHGRYHLYVSLACPWAHRTLIFRVLNGLQDSISVSVVNWLMLDHGWTFVEGEGVIPDPIQNARFLHQVYTAADPRFTGKVTVPVLWDKARGTIVSNESADIIRMLDTAWGGGGRHYPEALREEIDALNARIYDTLNNGVYKAGFATTQAAYEAAVHPLFETLDWLEGILSRRRYLCGDTITEADWRLFPTLLRFDAVYAGHFKCDRRRIADYPALSGYLRELYQWPGVRETVNFSHIRRHYYESHRGLNPHGIVPVGPVPDLDRPHGRGGGGIGVA